MVLLEAFIFLAYELLVSLLPCLAAFALLELRPGGKAWRGKLLRMTLLLCFVLYLVAVYHVTGVGTLYDGLLYQGEIRTEQINLSPFSRDIDLTGYLLNVLLFLPLGVLLPLIWKAWGKVGRVLCIGAGFSFLIEASQLLNNRSTDVDDLILNTLGAFVGFLLYKGLAHRKKETAPLPIPRLSPLWYIAITFAGRFFLFNDMGLARVLYGF